MASAGGSSAGQSVQSIGTLGSSDATAEGDGEREGDGDGDGATVADGATDTGGATDADADAVAASDDEGDGEAEVEGPGVGDGPATPAHAAMPSARAARRMPWRPKMTRAPSTVPSSDPRRASLTPVSSTPPDGMKSRWRRG